jgi:copper chaperone CopZ
MDKKIIIGIVVFLVLVFFVVENKKQVTGNVIAQDVENLRQVNLAIENMYCEACAFGVKGQLEELDGVVNADINYETASGIVQYDADKVNVGTIAAASTVYPAKVVADNKVG